MGILSRIGNLYRDVRARWSYVPPPKTGDGRPAILLLADRRGWAFDRVAQAIRDQLSNRFHLQIAYVQDRPWFDADDFDLVHVFFWGETWQRRLVPDPRRINKEISSHRWIDDPAYGPCTPATFVRRHLRDAGQATATSVRLQEAVSASGLLQPYRTPNGVDPATFHPGTAQPSGRLRFGWAGNIRDAVKRFDRIQAATAGQDLAVADGTRAPSAMADFYRDIDVFLVASQHEGTPLPLLEALASGCFVISADVGVAREVIREGVNGFICDGSVEGLRTCVERCLIDADGIRARARAAVPDLIAERSWSAVSASWAEAWTQAIARAEAPLLRNDDVGWDTDLDNFRRFCHLFSERGLRQVHGLTCFGRTTAAFNHARGPAEFPGQPPSAFLDNAEIRRLSACHPLAERRDLLAFLSEGEDDIALHGLYHEDYSRLTYAQQVADLEQGLDILADLLPNKVVRWFIPPFNRCNRHTEPACRTVGLGLLADRGVHLESELPHVVIRPGTTYRYHHHRFYPGSVFTYYPLSLDALAATLDRGRDQHGHP